MRMNTSSAEDESDGYSYVQSTVKNRWNDYLVVQLSLKRYPRDTGLEDLRSVLKVCGELGKGVYGVVYEAKIMGRDGSYQKVAVKNITTLDRPDDRETIFARMLREEIAYAYLNALVFLRISPNFALVHKSFLSRHQRRNDLYCFLLCMEKADGNLRQWITKSAAKEPHRFMSCVFQIFMAIVAFGIHLNLVHNDLYLKNILYTRISKTNFMYYFRTQKYTLSNCEYLFKISDFGICSSPTYLQNNHHEMIHMAREKRHANSIMDFDFSNHILEYENIIPYSRDSAVFLRSLLYADVHSTCKTWIYNALKILNDWKPSSSTDLGDFVKAIFTRDFLQRAGLSPNMFQGGSDASAEIFHVDGTEQTKRSMIFMAKDYIDSGRSSANGPATPATATTPKSTLF